jgi:hypothetical protein
MSSVMFLGLNQEHSIEAQIRSSAIPLTSALASLSVAKPPTTARGTGAVELDRLTDGKGLSHITDALGGNHWKESHKA